MNQTAQAAAPSRVAGKWISVIKRVEEVRAMEKALKDAIKDGAPLTIKQQGAYGRGHVIEAFVGKRAVFWAMTHSNKQQYLVRHHENLFVNQPVVAVGKAG